ncbi:hypothetical protein TNCV_3382331 [Trichonephila clavipes]|nr:hypothetical protein TNCV_3382331 [Trichonephila clavipes]
MFLVEQFHSDVMKIAQHGHRRTSVNFQVDGQRDKNWSCEMLSHMESNGVVQVGQYVYYKPDSLSGSIAHAIKSHFLNLQTNMHPTLFSVLHFTAYKSCVELFPLLKDPKWV